MHILDLLMYFVCGWVLWWLMDIIWQGEITNELGGLIGMLVIVIYTIIYIAVFWVGNCNWIDVFQGHYHINLKP